MDEVPHVLAEALVEKGSQTGDQGTEEHRQADGPVRLVEAEEEELVEGILQGAVEQGKSL